MSVCCSCKANMLIKKSVQLRRWNKIGDKNADRMRKACFWFANKQKMCIWEASSPSEHDTRLELKIYYFSAKCLHFLLVLVAWVHISTVLNWFSFRLHFISGNNFCNVVFFRCTRTAEKYYASQSRSLESRFVLFELEWKYYAFFMFFWWPFL